MTTETATAPGWYPVDGGLVRWWDGSAWTDQTQANPNAGSGGVVPSYGGSSGATPYYGQPTEGAGALVICGYIFAVLAPLVGLILGIIAWNKPPFSPSKKHGPWIVLLSVVVFVVALIVIVASQPSQPTYNY